MLFDPLSVLDPSALAIVLAGTAIATVARSGLDSCRVAALEVLTLFTNQFDHQANRAALARWIRAIRKSGLLGTDEAPPPDPALAKACTDLVRYGSLDAMRRALSDHQDMQTERSERGAQLFEQAGELAPVFGLVGTLFAITQMTAASGGNASAATFAAIATAVLSTLYGVLSAHLVLFPIANALARQADETAKARSDLIDWFAAEVADILPRPRLALKPAA